MYLISPAKLQGRNPEYSYHVANVRVRSEHSVGYLKGRFSSLRGLRLRIDRHEHLAYATFWAIACMVVHNFAMEHERNINFNMDSFFTDGLAIMAQGQAE